MNALVAVQQNATGLRSATPQKRAEVAKQVAEYNPDAATVLANKIKAIRAAVAQQMNSKQTVTGAKTAQTGASATAAKATSSSDSDSSTTRTVTKELDRDAFLKLFVMQLQNQDPMSPTDNTQMIAQLAQFSSLEQMNKLNESFTTLSSNIDQLNFMSAGALVGRSVAGTSVDGKTIQGTIGSVALDSGEVYLIVDGSRMALDKVTRIG